MKISPDKFHKYAFSDYLDNVVRGSLGEYLVAKALGITETPESSWESWDITYDKLKIEVKTSGYVQTWEQEDKSIPRFGIQKREGYVGKTSHLDGNKRRHADVYVFCLFTFDDYQDKVGARKAILDTSNWDFYVIKTADLPQQDTIGLWWLSENTKALKFDQLAPTINKDYYEPI